MHITKIKNCSSSSRKNVGIEAQLYIFTLQKSKLVRASQVSHGTRNRETISARLFLNPLVPFPTLIPHPYSVFSPQLRYGEDQKKGKFFNLGRAEFSILLSSLKDTLFAGRVKLTQKLQLQHLLLLASSLHPYLSRIPVGWSQCSSADAHFEQL